jgi:hypothetical protein
MHHRESSIVGVLALPVKLTKQFGKFEPQRTPGAIISITLSALVGINENFCHTAS